ncbi:hypothetical protein ASPZODRAFT_151150 [Penicilliopsis zonata CBS 506.65]|uniref:Survival protein SurE-like phosphatase/nucleotidase domain-containing protein n=1 Tax=Penicilliopsis zonata CBS 506.65 TaxID=1073090 RepID=A0A1L9SKF2_9EURO|nr:hypothetical protein ASPZODRAFT_151150 [Penicilliopsis zonata CBS 506.65]OJJ47690.1 hypothetical protein ASPZODRAFT_151150 [Penicilliopsis zonata CBS 506.65]
MHILVVNDDGPPSKRLSPYIRPFVDALEAAGHLVSVATPAASRSWIGKAHLIEASLTATYVDKDSFEEDGTYREYRDSDGLEGNGNEWVVVTNGTPASCTQLGLYNLFTSRGPIDLVVSGPNHGRNASTIYNLSSGTVGGALEAVTCGKRAIAVSFGSKDEQPVETICAASRLTVRVIQYLSRHWDPNVELYNLNVPMRADVESRPVKYTRTLPIYWPRGCLYAENEINGTNGVNGVNGMQMHHKQRHFKWSADLVDMKKALQAAEQGTDAHTVLDGCTSVTPLRANLWHVPGLEGELDIDIDTHV